MAYEKKCSTKSKTMKKEVSKTLPRKMAMRMAATKKKK
jgi:hypothetical protein